MSVIRTLFHISLAVFMVSLFLFFVSDKVFKKWLVFSIVWIFLTVAIVGSTPEYSGGFFDITPGKEMVSIWLSELFVIASFIKIVWDSIKGDKEKKTNPHAKNKRPA